MAGDTGPSMMTRAFTGHCNWRSQRSTVLRTATTSNEMRKPPGVYIYIHMYIYYIYANIYIYISIRET